MTVTIGVDVAAVLLAVLFCVVSTAVAVTHMVDANYYHSRYEDK